MALTDKQLAVALESLADALGAGLSLTSYLDDERTTMPEDMRKSLAASLSAGRNLGDAFERAEVLSSAELGLLRAGEASGRVESTLRLIAEAIEHRRKMRWQLVLGLAYPSLLVAFAFIILPLPTLVNGSFSDYLGKAIWGPLLVAGLAITLLVIAPRIDPKSRVRSFTARLGYSIPVMGAGLRMLAHATFARVLGHNIGAGLPLQQAVGSALLSCGHPGLEKSSTAILGALAHGRALFEALDTSNHFDKSFINMVANAERTGNLDSTLVKLAGSLSEGGSRRIKAALAGATMLIFFGTIAMIVKSIFGFYSGYYKF